MPIATLTNVRHGFGTHIVLDGATVSIEPGEKVGLVGRNGGGKSTLMKLIAGVWQPDFGTVSLARGTREGEHAPKLIRRHHVAQRRRRTRQLRVVANRATIWQVGFTPKVHTCAVGAKVTARSSCATEELQGAR